MLTTDNSIILYQGSDGKASLEVRLDHETVWLTQDQMAEPFCRERSVITKHLRNVFKEGELEENSVRAKYAHTAADGNKRIATALFIYFLGRNGILYRADGSKRLADNALVALTLLIAESRPEEKETIVKVIVNLINQHN